MRLKHALIDIDGVIAGLRVLREGLNQDTGASLEYQDLTEYDLASLYGISLEDVLDSFRRHDIIPRQSVLHGAREALELLGRTHHLHLITHRGWDERAEKKTADWLLRHQLPYDTLTIVPFGMKKSELYPDVAGYFDFMFEDNLSNLYDAERSGRVRRPVLIDHPWNQDCGGQYQHGIRRFSSLSGALARLLKADSEISAGV